MQQIKIYITAKREHAKKLREGFCVDGIHNNSRWMWEMERGDRPVTHWLEENFNDAIGSHYFILYVESGDKLKTSLIELGHTISYNKPILICGDRDLAENVAEDLQQAHLPHKDLDPWFAFYNIRITGSIAQTIKYIKDQHRSQIIKTRSTS